MYVLISSWVICWEYCCCFWICSASDCIAPSHSACAPSALRSILLLAAFLSIMLSPNRTYNLRDPLCTRTRIFRIAWPIKKIVRGPLGGPLGALFTGVRGETVWKSEWGRSMTYAPEHEKELLHRSHRRRMGVFGAPCSGCQQARTTENPHHPPDPKRGLLRAQERLSVEDATPRLPALGDRLLVVRAVAHRWNLRAAQRRAARGLAGPPGQEPASERGYRRLSVGQDHRGWR